MSNTKLLYAIIVVLLMALGFGGYYVYHDLAKQKRELRRERRRFVNDSIDRARGKAKAKVEKAAAKARQDSIAHADAMKKTHCNAYTQKLNALAAQTMRDGYGDCDYFLMDITKDGIPELWVKYGTCEADYTLKVFTCQNGACKSLYEGGAGHAVFYKGGSYVIRMYGQMGYQRLDKLTYSGGRIHERTILEKEIGPDEDYQEPKEKECEFYSYKNTRPIKKAFGVSD